MNKLAGLEAIISKKKWSVHTFIDLLLESIRIFYIIFRKLWVEAYKKPFHDAAAFLH